MPRLCASATSKNNPDVRVFIIQNEDEWYRMLTNDTPDDNEKMDVLVLSSMNFMEVYNQFLTMV